MGDDTAGLRHELVNHLQRQGHLSDRRVAAAFLATPREAFLTDHAASHGLRAVYRDEAIVTRRDPAAGVPLSSSSQPAIMARMLEMLDVEEGHRVLEIGTGTGYNAALLARLVGPRGAVTTIDIDPEVAATARQGLEATRSPARVLVGDGRAGVADAAPVHRIVVTASTETVPRAWYDQLVPGGQLVVPLRLSTTLFAVQAVAAFRKVAAGFDSFEVTGGGFMALRGAGDRHPRTATIVAPEVADRTDERSVVELSGPAIAALDRTARQHLLVTALGFARRRQVNLGGAPSWALAVYAALGLPQERLVECARLRWTSAHQHALGVIDAADGSLAFLVGGGQRARIEAHDGRGAEHALLNVVDRWQLAGRPTVEQLAIKVRYGPERPHAWCSTRRADQWIAFDFEGGRGPSPLERPPSARPGG